MGRKTALGGMLLGWALAGCGGSSGSGDPAPADGGTYGSVGELKDAAVEAGLECPEWDEHNQYTLAIESGTCNDSHTLALFEDDAAVELHLEMSGELGKMIELEMLIGQNWSISGPGTADLKDDMGGEVVRTEGKKG